MTEYYELEIWYLDLYVFVNEVYYYSNPPIFHILDIRSGSNLYRNHSVKFWRVVISSDKSRNETTDIIEGYREKGQVICYKKLTYWVSPYISYES